jgi:hypothetical protein
MGRYRVRVTYADGREAFICKDVSDEPAEYRTLAEATDAATFFRMGFDEGEVQAVTVVRK